MNYVPINGLRVLAVESGILFAAFVIAYISLRFLHPAMDRPRWLAWILGSNLRSVLLVIAVALAGRALLLPVVGIPSPRINDEYSYLLMADTFSHHRLTNPTPPAWQHFETFHVNMTPTYHSKYPVAQGLALACGEIVFHQPWIGIYLTTALLCGAIGWALQAFLPPGWALLGGLLAVVRIALLSYWMNSYWGGSMAALGGALALGAVVRLFQPGLTNRRRSAVACVFAVSLLILATSRPYEGLAFSLPLLVYFGYKGTRATIRREVKLRSTMLPVVLIGMAGLALMGYYNQRTTGNPLLLPHILNERTYSPLPLFLWQRAKPALTFHDPVFEKFFKVTEEEFGYEKTKSISGLISVESSRFLSDWFFYVGPALSFPALLGFFASVRQPRMRIAVSAALAMALALALCIYTMAHYAAPATVVVYLFAVEGLRYLWQQRHAGERAFVLAVCLTVVVSSLTRQTGGTAMNAVFTFRDARKWVAQQLETQPGKQLVLVSYGLQRHYPGNELVHNAADFNSEKILWARSKGEDNDRELCLAYSDRTFWNVNTDDVNVSLTPLNLCQHP
ncbi:MAG: hypothetical protein ABSD63_15215 [Candidatus Korobacteraceae bacterium]|jgi:hypothetical protein